MGRKPPPLLRLELKTPEGVDVIFEFTPDGAYLHAPLEPGSEGRRKRVAANGFFHRLLDQMHELGIRPEEVVRNRDGRIEGVRFCNHRV